MFRSNQLGRVSDTDLCYGVIDDGRHTVVHLCCTIAGSSSHAVSDSTIAAASMLAATVLNLFIINLH